MEKTLKIANLIVPIWAWVAVGGALGAVLRFLVASWVQKKAAVAFPLGTMTVNIIGSFVIGFFIHYGLEHLQLPPQAKALVVVGFLGAFTTFSSFSYETISLLSVGEYQKAVLYVFLTNIFCFLATVAGVAFARFLTEL